MNKLRKDIAQLVDEYINDPDTDDLDDLVESIMDTISDWILTAIK